MKKIFKIVGNVFIGIGVFLAITLLAWASWQVNVLNPHHDEWVWNFPPFPLSIAIWLIGFALCFPFAFVGTVLTVLFQALIQRIRRKKPVVDT
jgi:hypothetical protein